MMELPNIMHPVAKLSTALAAALMLSADESPNDFYQNH
uniref:Uncharacterized protein n=1 Tax=Klebsiella pneumoniae TaxID=573 RepID=A0A1P8VTU0_KLEPN|nr:hypothetical protein [Klebsiella pneumoniae]